MCEKQILRFTISARSKILLLSTRCTIIKRANLTLHVNTHFYLGCLFYLPIRWSFQKKKRFDRRVLFVLIFVRIYTDPKRTRHVYHHPDSVFMSKNNDFILNNFEL